MTPAEAILAATVNAAADVLNPTDRGTIAAGQRADLVLLHLKDERALAYELGATQSTSSFCDGQVIRQESDPGRR